MKEVKIFHGDCIASLRLLASNSVEALISDIPYGISFSEWDVLHSNTNSALLGSSPAQQGVFAKRGKPLNGWSEADREIGKEYQAWNEAWLVEAFRVLKPASPLLIMAGRQWQHRFILAMEEVGFVYKDLLIWDKVQAPARAQRVNCVLEKRGLSEEANWRLGNLAPLHEPIVYGFKPYKIGTTVTDCFIKDGLGCFNADVANSNILRVSSRVKDKQHETQKPIELMELLVALVTKEGATVLDPFMGSGTTGVACKKLVRNFIGIEADEVYFNTARERLAL
jgi:site-specific DNA-methyltransferase (adenine-specific)